MMNLFPEPAGQPSPPIPAAPAAAALPQAVYPSTVPCHPLLHPACKVIPLPVIHARAHQLVLKGELPRAAALMHDVARVLSHPNPPVMVEGVISIACQCDRCRANRAAEKGAA